MPLTMLYKGQSQWMEGELPQFQASLCGEDLETDMCLSQEELGYDEPDATPAPDDSADTKKDEKQWARNLFRETVLLKMREERLNQEEAENEVAFQRLLDVTEGDPNTALIFVIRTECEQICERLGVVYNKHNHEQELALRLVIILLHNGALANFKMSESSTELKPKERSALCYAVKERKDPKIVEKLLQHKARVYRNDLDLVLREENECDEITSMLLGAVSNENFRQYLNRGTEEKLTAVRSNIYRMFVEKKPSRIKVLDKLIDQIPSEKGKYKVYPELLDISGHNKEATCFNNGFSILHHIIITGDKEALSQNVISVVLNHKWSKFAFRSAIAVSMTYLIILVAFTFVLIVAAMTPDPSVYEGGLHAGRAVAEVSLLLATIIYFLAEIDQIKSTGGYYWRSPFNYLDLVAVILFVVTAILRYVALRASWATLGITYFLWVMRAFRFTTIFRPIGIFSQILLTIIIKDVAQFVVVCFLIILAFSGFLIAALRFDGILGNHQEVNSFWQILVTGTRTMVEQQPVLDYVGPDGFGILSAVVMVLFLFTSIIILLNILIARLSDTYQSIQGEAQYRVALNRALIIMRIERHHWWHHFRKFHQGACKDDNTLEVNLLKVLKQWDGGVLSEQTSLLYKIQEKMDSVENSQSYISKKLTNFQARRLLNKENMLFSSEC